ncbi:MAG: hypothetical protein ACI4PU_08155 [Intestinibacter sp.]
MKKILMILLIAILSVGCSKNSTTQEKSTDKASTKSEQTSDQNTLQIQSVEGYWEHKGQDESALLKFDWKMNFDLYYSDGSREECSYEVVESKENSIDINIKNGDKTTDATIKTNDDGETITLEKDKKEYYFVRIPKDQFYVKLVEDYKEK